MMTELESPNENMINPIKEVQGRQQLGINNKIPSSICLCPTVERPLSTVLCPQLFEGLPTRTR